VKISRMRGGSRGDAKRVATAQATAPGLASVTEVDRATAPGLASVTEVDSIRQLHQGNVLK